MSDLQLTIKIVSQERELISEKADLVIAPTEEGQITILPGHVPLFSKLATGELIYKVGSSENLFAVSQGFIDISPDNTVTVIADMASHARDISLPQAQKAIKDAEQTLTTSQDRQEIIMAEASLRQAMLEVKIARKTPIVQTHM